MSAIVQFGALGLTGMAGLLLVVGFPFSGVASCGYVLAGVSAVTFLGKIAGFGRRSRVDNSAAPPCEPASEEAAVALDPTDEQSLVQQMLAQDRFAILLRPQVAGTLAKEHVLSALSALDKQMSLVPEGEVTLRAWRFEEEDQTQEDLGTHRVVFVDALFLDRYQVTNRQFYDFVASGGYEQAALWDAEVLSSVVEFVDRTGRPGPRYWENGHYPVDEDDLPVVGVNWYEASAYARWAGKRLPTDAEWVKAASWPVAQADSKPVQRKFPWGDTMDRSLANLWGSGAVGAASVYEFPQGATVGGVFQMIGNVWEWTASSFGIWTSRLHALELPAPMKSLRGAAFDTYFDSQAQNNFQSGDEALARKHNIGFRCAVGICDVISDLIPNVHEMLEGLHNPVSQDSPVQEHEQEHEHDLTEDGAVHTQRPPESRLNSEDDEESLRL